MYYGLSEYAIFLIGGLVCLTIGVIAGVIQLLRR